MSIQEQLIDYTFTYLDKCIPVLEVIEKPDLTNKQKILVSLGFNNSSELMNVKQTLEAREKIEKENKEKREKSEELKKWFLTLLKGKEIFGPDTLLIRFEDFYNLMKKNDLVCGTFNDYLGEIPYKNLQEIKNLVTIDISDVSIIDKVHPILSIEREYGRPSDDNDIDMIHKFPFVVNVDYSFRPVDILGKKVGYWEGGYYRVSEKVGKPINYFICAPTNKMKSERFTVTFRRVKDPFICSYNQRVNSVFIHSRWGEESNSSIVKRYEKLNKLISERIVDLGLETSIKNILSSSFKKEKNIGIREIIL